jgi:transcriptional regulator with XRE-family HTH domain
MSDTKKKRLTILGQRLNELRGGESQAEFAKRIGISAATIGYYENSERLPDAETLLKISNACGKSCDWLVGRSRVGAPDDFIQAVWERYGLDEIALDALDGAVRDVQPSLNALLSSAKGRYVLRLLNDYVSISDYELVKESIEKYGDGNTGHLVGKQVLELKKLNLLDEILLLRNEKQEDTDNG